MEWLKSSWDKLKGKTQDVVQKAVDTLPKQVSTSSGVEKAVGAPATSTNLVGGKRRRTKRTRGKKRHTHKRKH